MNNSKITPAMMPKRVAKQVVRNLQSKRDENIARSAAPARWLTQRIGDLYPWLKGL